MEDDAGFLRVYRIDRLAARKAFAELYHALGKANLTKSLIAFFLRYVLSRFATRTMATFLSLSAHGGVVYYLVVKSVVRVPQGRVEDGEEAQLGRNDPPGRRCHCGRGYLICEDSLRTGRSAVSGFLNSPVGSSRGLRINDGF